MNIKYCRAIYDYEPENEDELRLKVGDVIKIVEEEEEGWLRGLLNDVEGVFPDNFVEIMEPLNKIVRSKNLGKNKKVNSSTPNTYKDHEEVSETKNTDTKQKSETSPLTALIYKENDLEKSPGTRKENKNNKIEPEKNDSTKNETDKPKTCEKGKLNLFIPKLNDKTKPDTEKPNVVDKNKIETDKSKSDVEKLKILTKPDLFESSNTHNEKKKSVDAPSNDKSEITKKIQDHNKHKILKNQLSTDEKDIPTTETLNVIQKPKKSGTKSPSNTKLHLHVEENYNISENKEVIEESTDKLEPSANNDLLFQSKQKFTKLSQKVLTGFKINQAKSTKKEEQVKAAGVVDIKSESDNPCPYDEDDLKILKEHNIDHTLLFTTGVKNCKDMEEVNLELRKLHIVTISLISAFLSVCKK